MDGLADLWQTTTTYGGDRVSVDPPEGGTPTTTFTDVRGRTTALWEYHGPSPTGAHDVTTYTYTPDGELDSVTDAAGNTWSYDYDLLGRQTAADDPDKGLTQTAYDAAGQVTTITDARGVTLGYTYDALGRKTSLRDGSPTGPKRAEWVYDTLAKGQLTKSIRFVGVNAYTSEVTGFDDGYRPTGTKLTMPAAEGLLQGTYETLHTYNVDGSPATTVLQGKGGLNSETLTHGYDPTGLPATLVGSGTYVSGSLWSPFGQPLQYTMGNTLGKEIFSTFTYEQATHRLESAQLKRQTQPTPDSTATYSYDAAGNVTKIADVPAAGATDTQCFSYDYLRRLTEAWTPASGNCATSPTVAGLGGPAPYWHSWTLNAVGNRLTETRHASAGDTTSTYSYPVPGADRPHAVSQVATAGPGGNSTAVFGYDAAGNTTARPFAGEDQTLVWDAEGHLSSVTDPSGTVAEFVYDGAGNRLLRRDLATGKTTLYWGEHTELTLTTATGVIKPLRYYTFNGTVIAVRDGKFSSNVTTFLPDHHGTATYAVANTTAALTVRRFDPYGNPRGTVPPSWKGDHGFVDGPTDVSLGLTHLGAREYDPLLGRFLSVDPLIDPLSPQTLNAYAYGNNAPPTFADPDGLAFFEGSKGSGSGIVVPNASKKSQASAKKQHKQRVAKAVKTEHRIMNRKKNNKPLGKGVAPKKKPKPPKPEKKSKPWWKKALNVAGEVTGFNDIKRCVGGDWGSCAWAAAGFTPIGKLAKGAKVANGVVNATPAARRIPDEAIVVRGGTKDLPQPGEMFSGAYGNSLNDAMAGVPHGQVRVTTAGDIRRSGGSVEYAPEYDARVGKVNYQHVDVCMGSGACPFGALTPSVVPKQERWGGKDYPFYDGYP